MERKLTKVQWENGDNKDRILFTIETTQEDGSVVKQQAACTTDSPDWEEALEAAGGTEALDAAWATKQEEKAKIREKREEEEKSNIERMKQEALFEVKLEIFEIEAIKNSKNRKIKSMIRKAKSQTEALVYAAACVNDAMQQEELDAMTETVKD